jgi:transcriptional regulator with XRE-family HTH domain
MKKYENKATEEFASRLKEALERKNGGNQSELARHVGCTPQAVNKWCAGTQFPRDRILRKIGEYLGVTPEYLKFGTPNVPPPPPPVEWLLMYVRLEEAELLTEVRELSEAGKRQFRAAAAKAEKLPADQLPRKADGTH